MLPPPEDPRGVRQVLLLSAAILVLMVVGVIVMVVFDSSKAGLVVFGGGAAAVGGVIGVRLGRQLNPDASTARMVFATAVVVVAVLGVIIYLATR